METSLGVQEAPNIMFLVTPGLTKMSTLIVGEMLTIFPPQRYLEKGFIKPMNIFRNNKIIQLKGTSV